MDMVTDVSVPIGVKIKHICQGEIKFFQGGSYYIFFHGICEILKSYQM